MLSDLLEAILMLLEKLAAGYIAKRMAARTAQNVADAPLNDREWTDDAKQGKL